MATTIYKAHIASGRVGHITRLPPSKVMLPDLAPFAFVFWCTMWDHVGCRQRRTYKLQFGKEFQNLAHHQLQKTCCNRTASDSGHPISLLSQSCRLIKLQSALVLHLVMVSCVRRISNLISLLHRERSICAIGSDPVVLTKFKTSETIYDAR